MRMRWLDSVRYRRQVEDWAERCVLLNDRLAEAHKAFDGVFFLAGLNLEPGERLIEVQPVNLMETRRVRVINYGSVSHHTQNHNTVRAGQARSESHDELREVDHGRLVLTDRRILYLGAKSREIRWHKLLQQRVGPGAAEFFAVGQKTPLQVTYSRASGAKLQFMTRVALAALDGSEAEFADDLMAELSQLRREPPRAPAGIDTDPRVEQFALSAAAPQRELPAVSAPAKGDALPPLPRGQFIHTPLEVVANAASSLGFTTTVIGAGLNGAPDPTVVALPIPPGVTSLGIELTIFACHPDQLVDLATQTQAKWSVVVSPVPVEGIATLDDAAEPPTILRIDEAALGALCDARVADGAAVQQLRGLSVQSDGLLDRLNTQLRLARSLTKKQQVLVLDESIDSADVLVDFAGADEVVLAGDTIVVEDSVPAAGVSDDLVILPVVAPITIAGTMVEHPEQRLSVYLTEHADTIARYDRVAGGFANVTRELIAATRVLRSRITHDEATWFVERSASAPWATVAVDARLADADPSEVGGLYDRGSALYDHFRADAPKGIKAAKIYKVLHLMRPGLYPILDSRLAALYDGPARANAPAVNACRPDLPASKWAYWAAIRADLLGAAEQIAALRSVYKASGDAYLARAVDSLSDVRILDILAWQDGEPSDD